MRVRLKSNHVFINCPFDSRYRPIFEAVVFAVSYLDFVPRSAWEEGDSGDIRLSKIERIIEECRYGINDLSAVALDPSTNLPRFNMPLELGLFLGCRRFGPGNQNRKRVLVLDSDPYRYRKFISDIAGQDIRAHGNDPENAIRHIRDWLQATSRRRGLAGGGEIVEEYRQFRDELPRTCAALRLEPDRLTFRDLSTLVADWLKSDW